MADNWFGSKANMTLSHQDLQKHFILEALRNVVEAHGGMSELSKKSSKGRNSLYKTISSTGNPYLRNTNEILQSLGFHLSIAPNDVGDQKRA